MICRRWRGSQSLQEINPFPACICAPSVDMDMDTDVDMDKDTRYRNSLGVSIWRRKAVVKSLSTFMLTPDPSRPYSCSYSCPCSGFQPHMRAVVPLRLPFMIYDVRFGMR